MSVSVDVLNEYNKHTQFKFKWISCILYQKNSRQPLGEHWPVGEEPDTYSLGRDGVAAEGDKRRKPSAPGKCQVSCRAECPLSCMNQLSYLSGGGEDKQSCRSKEFSNSENNRDWATTNASRAMDCSHPLFWKHKAFSGLLFSLF